MASGERRKARRTDNLFDKPLSELALPDTVILCNRGLVEAEMDYSCGKGCWRALLFYIEWSI